ncbi:MAG: PHP domain-containing protein [Planctomycetes bacterium]|nr:PHP domain-containing protein [Planctomycetota bacterium]
MTSPRVDLHSHTTLSDGSLPPRDLVRLAAQVGLDVLAITDHDTTEALAEALDEARGVGLRVIPGMEVSAALEDGGNVHVLGFFPADRLGALAAWQEERRALRRARMASIVARLGELGLSLDLEALGRGADPRRSPGRLHVARALVEAGHVPSVPEAFDRYLGKGKPAYVQDRVPTAGEAIAMIRGLGGVSVVAHPSIDGLDPHLEALAAQGLEGVEAYHFGHAPDVAAHFHARARALGLLVTGGSDYHGEPTRAPGAPPPAEAEAPRLGRVALPPDEWERFDAVLRARAGA